MDITEIIAEQHEEQRRLFAYLEQMEGAEPEALRAVWRQLHDLLEYHAAAEEKHFYPRLLNVGEGAADADSAADETEDAIDDHNDIRDAAAEVDRQEVGSAEWFKAVAEANVANSKHMAEEERQGLADFRQHASLAERHELAVRFLAFSARNRVDYREEDKDPKSYVREHQPG